MFRDKLKGLAKTKEKPQEGNDKKKIENLVFFVIILIITIVIINIIWNGNNQTSKEENDTSTKKLATTQDSSNESSDLNTSNVSSNLNTKLEEILSKIEGVGEVKVFINYSETSEVIAMYNENSKTSVTEETDTSGGVRKIEETDSQKDVVYQEENGEKTPITSKVIEPKIEGAIITAKGATNAEIKTNIIQAVEAVTGLATHKIQVFAMN